MSEYTKGPWAVHPQAKTAVHQPEFECWIPQNEADARLIAAAPDLLEALKEWMYQAENISNIDVVRKARAAIAKAEGK